MSNYTKYIIEIADEPVDGRYPVKGFTTFAFTEESLKKLEKLDEKVEEKAVKVYYYITDDFDIWLTRDDGEEVDMARKEVGNYFESCEKAERARDRMLEFLGRETYEKAALTREGMLKFLNGGYQHDTIR